MTTAESLSINFLDLASEQRLAIIKLLYKKQLKLSGLAKAIDSTPPEVSRNLKRLEKHYFVEKQYNGNYDLTTYGRTIFELFPSFSFLLSHKAYFKEHIFGDLPKKFVQRMGSFENANFISGFTSVAETWREIFDNAQEYVYGLLVEEPIGLFEPIISKAKQGIRIKSIFSDCTILPKRREKLIDQLGVKKLIEEGAIQRKIKDNIKTTVVLNETEGAVTFCTKNGNPDIAKSFYGNSKLFHEWCLDYFDYCWHSAYPFREKKLRSNVMKN